MNFAALATPVRRPRSLALVATSVLALACQGAARAACLPDPFSNGIVCSGDETGGLVVIQPGPVVITDGALVTAPAGDPAIRIVPPGGFGFLGTTIDLRGRIESLGNAGILVTPGGMAVGQLSLNIAADGVLTGAEGLAMLPDSRFVSLYVGNQGRISADTGSAVRNESFSFTLINSAGATISAGGAAATVAGQGGSIGNFGLIANTGTGAALSGLSSLSLTNAETGELRSAGGVALLAGTFFRVDNLGSIASTGTAVQGGGGTLRNEGVITGDLDLGRDGSSVILDNRAGTISGNVRLGGGDDTVITSFDGATGLPVGFAGTIDAGAGTDRLVFEFITDTRLDRAPSLPGGFEGIGLVMGDATVTLAAGFTAPGGIEIGTFTGGGTVVNQASLTAAGAVVRSGTFAPATPAFRNEGDITGTGTGGSFAIDLFFGAVTNTGSIVSSGGGVRTFDDVVNSGTITAAETAISGSGRRIINSGTIVSTAGIGVKGGMLISNSGTITGHTVGAVVLTGLDNSGTINGGVTMGGNAIIDNRSGGVINGDVAVEFIASTTALRNAGTINGDVDFATDGLMFQGSSLLVTLPGSRITGDVRLAPGTTLMTALGEGGPAATIDGTLTVGSNARLRYLVTTDATTSLALPTGFAALGYELADNARLTITGGGPVLPMLAFTGQGQVDLAADLVGDGSGPVIDLTARSAQAVFADASPSPNRIDLVSRGSIVMVRTEPGFISSAAVATGLGMRKTASPMPVSSGSATRPPPAWARWPRCRVPARSSTAARSNSAAPSASPGSMPAVREQPCSTADRSANWPAHPPASA